MARTRTTTIALALALVVASTVIWLGPTAASAESPAACPAGAVICGVVTDAVGPVAGVHVALASLADPDVPFPDPTDASTVTGPDGTWSLTPAAIGNPYTLKFVDPARVHLPQTLTGLAIDRAAPQFVSTTLVRVGRVSGTVTSAATGLPIFSLAVRLYDPATGKQVLGVRNVVPADGAGHYDFGPLPAGRYQVRFGPDTFSSVVAASYALQWSGGAPTSATSPVYDLHLGDSVVADASMVVAGSISGVLTGHDGSLLPADTTIRLYDDATGVVTKVRTRMAFRFDHVAPGSYHLRYGDGIFVAPVWFGQTADRASSTAVIVTAGSTSTADASFLS